MKYVKNATILASPAKAVTRAGRA